MLCSWVDAQEYVQNVVSAVWKSYFLHALIYFQQHLMYRLVYLVTHASWHNFLLPKNRRLLLLKQKGYHTNSRMLIFLGIRQIKPHSDTKTIIKQYNALYQKIQDHIFFRSAPKLKAIQAQFRSRFRYIQNQSRKASKRVETVYTYIVALPDLVHALFH